MRAGHRAQELLLEMRTLLGKDDPPLPALSPQPESRTTKPVNVRGQRASRSRMARTQLRSA
jgi:hypothetical protein